MKKEDKKISAPKCSESCACDKSSDDTKIEKASETAQDPTKFGDWQINGRAIDF